MLDPKSRWNDHGYERGLLGRCGGSLLHFDDESGEAGIGVKGLEVAVGLSIFGVEITSLDGAANKFECFVAMPSESSATGEVIVCAAKTWLARLFANAFNAIGIDFASFGVFAFDEKSGGEAGQGLDGFGMIGAKDTPLGFQDGALTFFGFGKFAIPLKSASEIAGSDEGIGIIGAENVGLGVDNFVIDGFGFSEAGGGIESIGKIGFDSERIWMIRAKDMSASSESFALKFLSLIETAKFLEGAGEV